MINFFSNLSSLKIVIFITILGFILYSRSFSNQFVWDDYPYIISNPEVRSLNLKTLFGPNTFNSINFYRPVSATYFAVVYALAKDSPFLYHFFQIVLHIANASLVYFLLKSFIRRGVAFFLSLVFLVHPINVESVASIVATQVPLLFLFGISALFLVMKSKTTNANLVVVSSLILLSMLTKEAGILFIPLIILFLALFRPKQVSRFGVVLGFVITLYLVIRLTIGQVGFSGKNFTPIASLPLSQRLLNIPSIVYYYLKTVTFPADLAINQLWYNKTPTIGNFYMPLFVDVAFFVLIAALGFKIRKAKKYWPSFVFFLSWFLLGLAVVLQVFPLDMTVAERWFYFPMVGLLGLAGLALQKLKFRSNLLKQVCITFGVIVLVLLSLRTYERIKDWKDPITLYSHDLQIHDNYEIEENLGFELATKGSYEEALMHFNNSVSMNPYEMNLRNLGSLYAKRGDTAKAKEYYQKALQATSYTQPGKLYHELTYTSFAELLLYAFNTKEDTILAKRSVEQGLKDYPKSAELWKLLSLSNYRLNEKEEALIAIFKAYGIKPDGSYLYFENQIKKNLYRRVLGPPR